MLVAHLVNGETVVIDKWKLDDYATTVELNYSLIINGKVGIMKDKIAYVEEVEELYGYDICPCEVADSDEVSNDSLKEN